MDVLNEMIINDVNRYAITEPDVSEYLMAKGVTTNY